ncbi:molybdopterin-binding protein [Arabiibacter massiliensis]|uniref:hypothetical protein n=1 Tax=Arabiibacter massiliensis TaxID=1870985 RepID=UPI0009BC0792|nr:hypothetical protein [Arabiibacter massiliensis]
MNETTTKVAGAFASLTLLVGAGAAVAVPAIQDGADEAVRAGVTAEDGAASESPLTNVSRVVGNFSFDQGVLSSNEEISNVFCKAAATLCSSLPGYGIERMQSSIDVSGDVGNAFSATVDEMKGEKGAASHVMACACASNVAGGGAIANAEVEGVSLESIAEMAEAR